MKAPAIVSLAMNSAAITQFGSIVSKKIGLQLAKRKRQRGNEKSKDDDTHSGRSEGEDLQKMHKKHRKSESPPRSKARTAMKDFSQIEQSFIDVVRVIIKDRLALEELFPPHTQRKKWVEDAIVKVKSEQRRFKKSESSYHSLHLKF